MQSADFLTDLRRIGALKKGHFLLASGRHSSEYIEKFDLLRQPRDTQRACAQMIALLEPELSVELVVGPTTGGILLAFEIGRQLGLPAAYAERIVDGGSERTFKRGTIIAPHTKVLLVDDILTTGSSIRETLSALERARADVRSVAVLVDRSGGNVHFGVPLKSLATLNIDTWMPDDCPLCAAGNPVTKPGSTSIGSAPTP